MYATCRHFNPTVPEGLTLNSIWLCDWTIILHAKVPHAVLCIVLKGTVGLPFVSGLLNDEGSGFWCRQSQEDIEHLGDKSQPCKQCMILE